MQKKQKIKNSFLIDIILYYTPATIHRTKHAQESSPLLPKKTKSCHHFFKNILTLATTNVIMKEKRKRRERVGREK